YIYSYVCAGELVAFLIGWNLILEYIIGSASVVKGLFTYLDALINNAMSKFLQQHMPINLSSVAPFPDLFSLGVTIVFSVALALGAKESSMVNNVFTSVNLLVVLFVIITGFWQVDTANWFIPKNQVPSEKYGNGGFAPYGINGIIKGAATCFYGFIGFDCIATAGEEAKSPRKSIPIAVIACLLIVFLAYFTMSTVLTMMLPYYDQDENAPFPHVYNIIGWPVAKYIVSIGALCGLLSSLLGAMFPLPRIIYAMASDGLLFEFMGKIHPKFQTPFLGTLLAGLFTGLLCFLLTAILSNLGEKVTHEITWQFSIIIICIIFIALILISMSSQPKSSEKLHFAVSSIKSKYNFFNVLSSGPICAMDTCYQYYNQHLLNDDVGLYDVD
ncbi:Amino acid permease, partial [Oryctes borbonicus]